MQVAAPRDKALILLCAHGELRIEEALSPEWVDVDLPGGILIVRHGKGGKQRRVTLPPSVAACLKTLPQTGRVIGATQTAARQRLKRIVKQTGNLEYAARHLGHSSTETTRVCAEWRDRAG